MRQRRQAIRVDLDDPMINAREGVLFFWQAIDQLSPLSLSTGAWTDNKWTKRSAMANAMGGASDPGQTREQRGEALKTYATWLAQKLCNAVGWNENAGWLHWIIDNIIKELGPFVGSIIGGIKGLYKIGSAIAQKVKIWWVARKVTLAAGHPQAIASGIKKLINSALLEGLYDVAKSALTAGVLVASAGASSIVSAVASVIELIVKMVHAAMEASRINKLIEDCAALWQLPRGARAWALSGAATDFNTMFRTATEKTPVIAPITLCSCLSGDKMRLLKMYGDDGTPITQSSFDAGCVYLDSLKNVGREYCKRWGDTLQSDDPLVKLGLKLVRDGYAGENLKRPWYKRLPGFRN
ncbi:hypothetical protein [Stieleria sp.]|uniref:hypothetical protein n=1 Tax=Stieleria sp. TaxID=2795976 RepID=UPI003562D8B0